MLFARSAVRSLKSALLLSLFTLMATRISLSRSVQPICLLRRPPPYPRIYPSHLHKSRPCPLWSSSFSHCLRLQTLRKSTPSTTARSFSAESTPSEPPQMSTASAAEDSNPLLKDFDFTPFDAVAAEHVRPGIRALLKKLVSICICMWMLR